MFPFYISIYISTLPTQYTMFTFNTTADQLNRDEPITEADYLVADYYKINNRPTNRYIPIGVMLLVTSPHTYSECFMGFLEANNIFNITEMTRGDHLVHVLVM